MKGKKFLSISIAAACLLMNTPLSVFAVGNTGANEVRVTDTSSAADIQVAVSVPQTAAIPAVKAAAVTPTTAEPYTLTAEDVDVTRCREDDNDSNTPYMDAVQISWRGVTDLSQPQYKNIVIPDTMPFDKPVLDDEGNEQRDEEGNVITETVDMPVIKAYLNPGEFGRSNLEKVTVSKNVRVLGDFSGCENLSEIVIPEDSALEAFSRNGFSKTAIQTLYIPANVTELPERMFYDCKNLTTVTFAEGSKLEKIGAYAFRESGLTAIDIPDAVTEFGEYAFNHCALEEISLPDAMTEIPQYTFAYCTTLKKVSFGSGVIMIGDFSFQDTAIEELVIPDSVISIGRGAFNNIDALRSVTIGSGIKQLGGCLNLGDDGVICVPCFQNDVNIETLILSEGLEKIGDEMFKWSGKIETLVIPSTVKHIGRDAFGGFNGISGSEVHALSSLTFADNSQLENIFEYAFCFCSIKHLKLPTSKTPFKIWDSAFGSNGELMDVDLGNCKEIGSATAYSSEQVYLENGAIGGAFAGCRKLKTVNFEEDEALEVINHDSFDMCDELLGPVVFPTNLKKIGHSAFNGCASLDEVTFNEGLETIGNCGFLGCNLSEIILPDTVTSVGGRCFEGNYGVERVKFSANMTVIPYRFLDCYPNTAVFHGSSDPGLHSELKELVIPDNIKEIGVLAFEGCLDLETLDLGKVEIIRAYAFSLPDTLTEKAGKKGSLKTVKMSPSLKEIGNCEDSGFEDEASYVGNVFAGHDYFDGLELPSTLEHIYDYAFANCPSVKEFTMTGNLQFVGSNAFAGCENLKTVNFTDMSNDDENGVIQTEFKECIFLNCTGLESVVLPSGLETVPVRMFSGCSNLSDVTWNERIETIGGGAFADTALTNLELPESCLYIDEAAFQNAPITSVKLGSKTAIIGDNAFVRDTNKNLMNSVTIPESVKKIGERAFGYYKDTDKGYAELCKEAERMEAETGEHVDVQSLIPPTIANNNFILYGGTAAKKYAEQNNMIYGGASGDTQDIVYPVTEGSEQNISTDATEATFRINCDYEKFSGVVKVDGKELKRGTDYTDKSGSTVITLTESYLKTLAPGKHTMEAVFEDGYAKAGFTIEEAAVTTTETTTTTSTLETTTTSTETTTTSATTTDPTTSTEEPTVSASAYEMSNWAENDYYKKTGVEPYASEYKENDDGTLTITLLDKVGKVLDKYTVHSKTGIGFNSSGEEVNLPQTGINTASHLLIVIAAFLMLVFGAAAVWISDIGRRREEDEG